MTTREVSGSYKKKNWHPENFEKSNIICVNAFMKENLRSI